MRKIAMAVFLLAGCDALEPAWGERYWVGPADPVPNATCNDLCELDGQLCLVNSCEGINDHGATWAIYDDQIATDPSAFSSASCETPFSVWEEPGWSMHVACCCTTGAS